MGQSKVSDSEFLRLVKDLDGAIKDWSIRKRLDLLTVFKLLSYRVACRVVDRCTNDVHVSHVIQKKFCRFLDSWAVQNGVIESSDMFCLMVSVQVGWYQDLGNTVYEGVARVRR